MFTGIVQGTATVESLITKPGLLTFRLALPSGFTNGLVVGASVIPETLRATTFSDQSVGSPLNIEIERQTQVFVDTVRDAIHERLGALQPIIESLLRDRGLSLDELARPPRLVTSDEFTDCKGCGTFLKRTDRVLMGACN
jgi:hypothetical protein